MRDRTDKHHLYDEDCREELGLDEAPDAESPDAESPDAESPDAESADEDMCGGPSKRPCKDCGSKYCPGMKGETAVLVRKFIIIVGLANNDYLSLNALILALLNRAVCWIVPTSTTSLRMIARRIWV